MEPICIKKSPAALRFASPGTVQFTFCSLALLVKNIRIARILGGHVLANGIARVEGVCHQIVRTPSVAVKCTGIEDNDIALAVVVEMVLGKVVIIFEADVI